MTAIVELILPPRADICNSGPSSWGSRDSENGDAGARGLPDYGAPADNPSHRGIASRADGVVYVLMATEAAEDGSAKQSRHRVPTVLAGARVDKLMAGHVRQAERVIKLAAGRPSGVDDDSATVELKLQAAAEIEPKRPVNRFTRRFCHMPRPKMRSRYWFSSQNQRSITSINGAIWEMRVNSF